MAIGAACRDGDKETNVDQDTRPQKSMSEKVVETGFLVATWLALGLYLEIFGPTLIDLKIKLNTDYEKVAVAVSGRSFGLFPGCVIGGYLVDKFGKYCHLMLAISLDIAAIVTVIIPWSPNVEFMWFLCFVGGFMESVVNIAGQRCILKLWLDKSTTPMILLHSGYGFGSFLIPLYTNPFLAVKRDIDVNSTVSTGLNKTTMNSLDHLSNSTVSPSTEFIKESRIEYSYAISAALVAIHSLSFYVFQVRERRYQDLCSGDTGDRGDVVKPVKSTEDRTLLQMINPATCAGGRLWYGIQMFSILFIFFANANGGERIVGGFLRSFSVDQLEFSNADASYINTIFWIFFAVGRISFSVAAKWISVRIIVLIETGGFTVVAVCMNIFALDNSLAYWILVPFLGIFVAPLWPTFVAWADHHLELTGMGMMLILLGGSVGGIGHLALIGYLYEHIGSHTFLYQILGYAGLALLLAIVLNLLGARHGNRFTWAPSENERQVTEMVYVDKTMVQYELTENDNDKCEQ